MKRLLRLIPVLLSLGVVWLAGCKEDDNEPPQLGVGQIQVSVAQDSLCYVPGDTITTTVTVTVLNSENAPMAGIHVNAALSDTESAQLLYADSTLGDTTDQDGQVEYVYWPQAPGSNWIRALVDGHSDSVLVIMIVVEQIVPSITIWFQPDTVTLNPPDSSLVWVRIADVNGIPINSTTPIMQISGGLLDAMPPTNAEGISAAYWHPTEVGRFQIRAGFHWVSLCHDDTLLAADSVTAVPIPPVGQVQIVAPDTIQIVHGDTTVVPVTFIVTSQEGHALPGRVVGVSLSNPSVAFLEFANPQLRDTTDAFGQMRMTYHAFDAGLIYLVNVLSGNCEGMTDTHSIVTVWAP